MEAANFNQTQEQNAAALPSPDSTESAPKVVIYADGSCLKNGTAEARAGAGIVLMTDDRRRIKLKACFLGKATNQQAEILACAVALESLKRPARVQIFSDSKYVVETMLGKNRMKTNREFWNRLINACLGHYIEWNWTRGHSGEAFNDNSSTSERDILARAILAKFYLDVSKENLESLTEHGDLRRFLIYDEISGRKRRLSLFDLERRAEKSARQELKKLKITDQTKREQISKTLVASEMEKNADGIERINTILRHLITKESQNLSTREKDYEKIKPQAERIRRRCASENRKLPVPNLTLPEVEMLQTRSVEKRDVRTANYFERVRRELARERGTPTRTDEEIQRLKPLQILSELKAKALEKQLKNLTDRKRFFPVEIDGKRWSVGKADALIAKSLNDENRVAGKITKFLGKIGIVEKKNIRAELDEIRDKITGKLDEKSEALADELSREKSVGKMLNEFYAGDNNSEKENFQPKFTAKQLAEIESLAFELKLADVYRENFVAQKLLIENSGVVNGNIKRVEQSPVKVIAGRAVAHEIMCEAEVARAREELASFRKNKTFQKFEMINAKTGEAKFVSLKEVEFDSRGSILDQTLEFFTENREKRRTRNALEKLVKDKQSELKENFAAAKAMLNVAAEETGDYKQKSFFGAVKYLHSPLFTPKELITLELRAKKTEDKAEATKLQKILNSVDQSKSVNLPKILENLTGETEVSKRSEQQSTEKQMAAQSAAKTEAVENKISISLQTARDAKTENPIRGK